MKVLQRCILEQLAIVIFLQLNSTYFSDYFRSRLSGIAAACHDGRDTACLDFNATAFNSFYVVLFWAGGITAIFSGFFISRYGVWVTSLVTAGLLFTGM